MDLETMTNVVLNNGRANNVFGGSNCRRYKKIKK